MKKSKIGRSGGGGSNRCPLRIGAGPTLPLRASFNDRCRARDAITHLYAWTPRKPGAFRGSVPDKKGSGTRLFRRPTIRLGAGGDHQHCPLGVAEAVSVQERLDGLLVVDDCERGR